jgi:FeS assembly SUF system protein
MGLGDRLSRLFKGEETKSNEEVRANTGEENPDIGNIEGSQAKGEMVEGNDGPSQAEVTKNEGSSHNTPPVTKEKILEVLSDIYDPEIPVDIVNLGLIYGISIDDGKAHVRMTLTSPGCPTAAELVYQAQVLIEEIPGVKEATVEVVWDPPWDPSRMSDEAKQVLGFY